MKIASWNVNSLRVRLPQVLDWLATAQPDLLGIQETKCVDAQFPHQELEAAGYQVIFNGQKTYNGVAILSRLPEAACDIATDLPGLDDPQRRVLAARYDTLRLINLYVPNGAEVGSDKYAYKLDWLDHLATYLEAQLTGHAKLIVIGDFNIAPDERDIYAPEKWADRVLFSAPEHAAFERLRALGLSDTFRLFDQEEATFSWWDYRAAAFRRNLGARIDHILASPALSPCCTASYIDKAPRHWERPSDHAPVVAEFNDG